MACHWMPMYWGDYIKDTMHLSTLEHGAYLLLIAHCWNTRKPIKDDDAILRRITRTGTKQWNAIRPTIENLFLVEGGFWQHERVNREVGTSAAISTQQSSNSMKRWNKSENQEAKSSNGKAAGIPRARVSTTTPTSSSKDTTPSGGADATPKENTGAAKTKQEKLTDVAMQVTKWEDYCKTHDIRCNVVLEIEKFTQYCLSGKGNYTNYEAAFRNWLLKRKEDRPHGTATQRPGSQIARADKGSANRDALIESARQQGLLPDDQG